MRTNYQQEFENIVQVSNYKEFLNRLGCNYSPAQMTILLRNAVRAACAKHYGGLKLMDLVGDTLVEKMPTATESPTMMATTWEEIENLISDEEWKEIREKQRRVWLDRQKELRKQEKVRQNQGKYPPTRGKDESKKGTALESSWKKSHDSQVSSPPEKGRERSWERGGGGKVRRSPHASTVSSATPTPHVSTRSERDVDWRKK
jgi:hypothetical protein